MAATIAGIVSRPALTPMHRPKINETSLFQYLEKNKKNQYQGMCISSCDLNMDILSKGALKIGTKGLN